MNDNIKELNDSWFIVGKSVDSFVSSSSSTLTTSKIFFPLTFNCVSPHIYRSSYPIPSTYASLERFHFKTFLSLNPSDIKENLRQYTKEKGILLKEIDVKINQEPFLLMDETSVREAVNILINPELQPVLVFCNNGKLKTSCVIGCLRKVQQWGISSILDELESFNDPETNYSDILYIERFSLRS